MRTWVNLDDRYRFVRRRWQVLFAVVDRIGAWLLRAVHLVRPAPPAALDADSVRRVLLVQLDHLGDAVITTGMLPTLRRRFPTAPIDVLASPWNCEVFASRREIGRIFVSRCNRFRRGPLRLLWPFALVVQAWKLRRGRYDLAIDVRGDFSIALLLAAAGIPRRVGWSCAGGGFLLTHDVPFVRGRAEIESRRELLRTLGAAVQSELAPELRPTIESQRFILHMLGEFGRGDRPLFVFHVGAGTSAKSWPVEHWRELLGRAIVDFGARVVLVGGRGDQPIAQAITEQRFWPGVMDWTGRLSLDQLAALARRANVFVGGDSGPAHVAAAVGAPVVALFSGTNDPRQWRPHGPRVAVVRHEVACAPCYLPKCPLREHLCMRDLTPSAVVAAIVRLLDDPSVVPPPHSHSDASRREKRT